MSEEKKNAAAEEEKEQPENTGENNEQAQEASMKEEKEAKEEEEKDPFEKLQEQYDELNEKYLRLYSEFENFRRRTQKEKVELYKTAGEDVMKALLPVIDDFDRAKKSMEQEAEDLNSVKEGFALIHHKLSKALEQKGLEEIEDSVGEKLDVDKHEAITKIPAPSDKLKGKIVDEVEKGYMLNGKVIRHTKVVVGE